MSLPFYAVPSYPTPQVVYATPYTSSIHPFLAHEILRVQAARRQYVEEQSMLAQCRQREVLRRQVEHRQRERLAALHRRTFAHPASPYIRRQMVVRPDYASLLEEPNIEDYLGKALAELLGLDEAEQVKAEEARSQQAAIDAQRAAIEDARKAAAVEQARKSAIAEQMKKVAAARKAAEADRLRRAAIYNARLGLSAKLEALCDEVYSLSQLQSTLLGQDSSPADSVDIPVKAPADVATTQVSDSARVSRERAAHAIQHHWRSRSADKAAFKDAMNTITRLRDRFEFLKRTFNPPERLEFRELSHGGTAMSGLSYASANVSVHAYTNELTKLLMLADGVPSAGNGKVRDARRSFVKMVEKALDEVEAMVADVLERQSAASSAASRTATPAPATGDVEEEKAIQLVQEANVAASATPETEVEMETDDVRARVGMQSAEFVEEQSRPGPVVVEALLTEAPTVDSTPIRIEIDTPSQSIPTPELSVLKPEATEAVIFGPAATVGSVSPNVELAEENVPKAIPVDKLTTDEEHATPFGEEVLVPLQVASQDVVESQVVEISPESARDVDLAPSATSSKAMKPDLHLSETVFPTETGIQPKPTSPASDSFDIVYPDSPSSQQLPDLEVELSFPMPKDDGEALEQDSASSTTSLGEEGFEVI